MQEGEWADHFLLSLYQSPSLYLRRVISINSESQLIENHVRPIILLIHGI